MVEEGAKSLKKEEPCQLSCNPNPLARLRKLTIMEDEHLNTIPENNRTKKISKVLMNLNLPQWSSEELISDNGK
ncbi:hypothetical protein Tco_1502592 [Tanacetum coccineum]